MDDTFFINKMTGNWIVQSTNYSLLKHDKSTNTFLNQVKWSNLNYDHNKINNLVSSFNKNSILHKTSIYNIESTKNGFTQKEYCTLIYNKTSSKAYILKFNYNFNLIRKFVIRDINRNYLFITSTTNNITIIEKIYFFHNNLKVIKSIIKKNNKCIGISFSSEIRIS